MQANLQEGRHALARKIFGRAGQLYQRYQDGMEDRIGALGLVLNALVLFNTRYMDAALTQLRADGFDVRDEDVVRLSPFGRHHINVLGRFNVLGRYSFQLPDLPGGLRPLRDPRRTCRGVGAGTQRPIARRRGAGLRTAPVHPRLPGAPKHPASRAAREAAVLCGRGRNHGVDEMGRLAALAAGSAWPDSAHRGCANPASAAKLTPARIAHAAPSGCRGVQFFRNAFRLPF